MSVVTNIMITGLLMVDEEADFIAAMRTLTDPYHPFTDVGNPFIAGDRNKEGSIFVGAFNYLEFNHLAETLEGVVRALDRDTVENMQIFIKGNDDEKWSMYDLQQYVEDFHPGCKDFERGENNGDCVTTGHELCNFCKHKLKD